MSLAPALPATGLWPLLLASSIALAAYLTAALQREPKRFGAALAIGWIAQGAAIALHTAGLDQAEPGARFGFAPALSITLWLVVAVYGIESRFVPIVGVRRSLALLGAIVVMVAWMFPGELRPHAGSPWAPLHWVLGIASYGLFGVALLHAALMRRSEQRLRPKPGAGSAGAMATEPGLPLLKLEALTFRFVAAGFVVLSATLALGWWFSQPWRWDHKAVFSILAWGVFAALLGGRRAFGWRGRIATRWLYAGAGLLLLAYVGSRFVIEVLLGRTTA
ncbi:MAG TPA: cytochrome c biogenesis protein CcsA [Methylibium sp.]|uniref:cytochrome C assembly family protein n=1 Tax=Methylibium sp. TaxID=2067992 RepID=UPI002DBC11FB|nr:cytochrome c biogenesis protein CcsA [Methylibium sp.]HEU4457921.1 cytochrome c biogenesis protein CcsA [Methylibium sp.]